MIDFADCDQMNGAYAKFFKGDYPSRTTLRQNSDLRTDSREQVSVIAVNFHTDCDKKLRDGEPRIEVLTASNPSLVPAVHEGKPGSKSPDERKNRLEIISMTLQPGEDMIVGKRVREILSAARKAAVAPA
jgi:hypothetical protein